MKPLSWRTSRLWMSKLGPLLLLLQTMMIFLTGWRQNWDLTMMMTHLLLMDRLVNSPALELQSRFLLMPGHHLHPPRMIPTWTLRQILTPAKNLGAQISLHLQATPPTGQSTQDNLQPHTSHAPLNWPWRRNAQHNSSMITKRCLAD